MSLSQNKRAMRNRTFVQSKCVGNRPFAASPPTVDPFIGLGANL
jgi:hypothetical protein